MKTGPHTIDGTLSILVATMVTRQGFNRYGGRVWKRHAVNRGTDDIGGIGLKVTNETTETISSWVAASLTESVY